MLESPLSLPVNNSRKALQVSKCEECGKVKLNLEKKLEYSKANSQSIDPDYEDYGF